MLIIFLDLLKKTTSLKMCINKYKSNIMKFRKINSGNKTVPTDTLWWKITLQYIDKPRSLQPVSSTVHLHLKNKKN